MIKYCCFILVRESILKPSLFLPKFKSKEEQICHLVIEHVNDKSPVSQEKSIPPSAGGRDQFSFTLQTPEGESEANVSKRERVPMPRQPTLTNPWDPVNHLPSFSAPNPAPAVPVSGPSGCGFRLLHSLFRPCSRLCCPSNCGFRLLPRGFRPRPTKLQLY